MSIYDHTVLLPVLVPKGKHCWDGRYCCKHYRSRGRSCGMSIGDITMDEYGYPLRPEECLELHPEEES